MDPRAQAGIGCVNRRTKWIRLAWYVDSHATQAAAKMGDPEESERFLETAKAVEARDDPKEFERAFKKVVLPRVKPKPSR